MDVSEILQPKLNDAQKNTDQLKSYYETLGVEWGSAECNPMTDVVEIMEELEVFSR